MADPTLPQPDAPAQPTLQQQAGTLIDQAGQGLLSGIVEMPKTMLLDFPALAMRASDYLGNKIGLTHITPQEQANEPVLHGLDVASKAYDDAVRSVLGTTDETANSTAYNVGSTVGSFVAWPGGAEKAIMEAPSLIGKGWRAVSHALNPQTIPGKVAAGVAWGAGVPALLPQPAEAGQADQATTAPHAVSDTGLPQIAPVGNQPTPDQQLPQQQKQPQLISDKWRAVGQAPTPQPADQPTGQMISPNWRPVPIHPAIDEHAAQRDDDSWWPAIGLGTAAAITLGLLTKGKFAKSALTLSREGESIFGKAAAETHPAVGEVTKWVSGQIDGGAAARDTMMKANPNLGQDFSDRMTLANPTALGEKTQTALRDGEIASTNTKLNPLVDIANKLAGLTQTDPNAAEKLNKYGYALDALQGANQPPGARRMVRLYDGWQNDVPNANTLTDAQARAAVKQHLQGVVDAIEQPRLPNGNPNPDYSPDIMQLQNQLKQNYASIAKHLYKSGVIDRPTYLDWSTRDYMPLQARLDQGSWLSQIKKSLTLPEKELDPRDEWSSLLERKNNDGERILSPIDAQEQYIRQAIRYTEQNSMKRMYVEAIKALPPTDPLRSIVSDVTNTAGVKNLLSYKVNGMTKNVQIKDPYVYNALQFNPGGNAFLKIMNSSRQFMQKATTGILAPGFAPAGALYDMWGIAALGNKVGPLGLLKVPYWTARGFAQGLGARMAGGMSQSLKAAMYADGTIPKLLGPQVTQTLINRGSQIWKQSLLYKAQKIGAMGTARAMDDASIGRRLTFMKTLAPRYATTNPLMRNLSGLARMYTGLFHSIQESARLGYFEHLAGQQPRLADLIKAGAETRRVTGDFAQSGTSKFAHTMSSVFPYYNISMQSMARIAHQFREKPMQTMTQVSLGLAMPSIAGTVYASMMGPKYRDYYWNKLNSNDRAANIYLPVPGMPPQRGIFIPVMPEWRPFHAMLLNMMDGVFGLSNGLIDRPENAGSANGLDNMFNTRMYSDVGSGIASGISPISPPPIANAALAALGVNLQGSPMQGEPWKLAPMHPDDLSALDPDGSTRGVWMPQKVEQIISALAGTAGQAFVHAAVAAQQAWHGNRAVIPAVGQAAALDMTRNIPLSTTMWKLDRKIGANTPMDQYASNTFNAMKNLAKSAGVDISNVGIGTRGVWGGPLENELQFNQGPDPNMMSRFRDPQIAQIVANSGLYMRLWSKNWGNALNATHKQIEDVRSDARLSPGQQRTKLNRLYAHVQDLHKAALSDIEENFIKPMQLRTGRAIDISKIDTDSQITDFPLLNAPSPPQ